VGKSRDVPWGVLALAAGVVGVVIIVGIFAGTVWRVTARKGDGRAGPSGERSDSESDGSRAPAPTSGPAVGECPVFPPDNPWNTRVDDLPVHPNSDGIIDNIGAREGMHPDFGPDYRGHEIGIPVNYVVDAPADVGVDFRYDAESDAGPYPLAGDVKIEDGSERHVLTVHEGTCTLYELYNARGQGGEWSADSGAIFDLTSNDVRPPGWTSADAAGLPIFPGLARFDEVVAGEIAHALRFSASETRKAYLYPARHAVGSITDPDVPPMGLRVRLRADFPVEDFPPQAQVILRALQRYGMMLADQGGNWFITGEPSQNWNQEDIDTLRTVKGRDFEVVDTSSLEP
jgi:hypothetical protein